MEEYGIENAKKIKIIYGGAVNENNAKQFIIESTFDGVLVGRLCMKEKPFSEMVNDLYYI